ncbi:MAG: CMP/dCMP kinase [Frankiales bacterium]|nr:CMP/dCMP kinase [Frankiales bacterium]
MHAEDSAQMVVAIDGPSGSGKSTVARGVAARLGFGYLDTGATYRAVTWLVLGAGLPLGSLADETERLSMLLAASDLVVGTTPGDREVRIGGHDVTEVIRGPEVTAAVSAVAATTAVRTHLSKLQRSLAAQAIAATGGIVVEGRDIGTVIFPDARLKVWLTASAEARGRRRAAEHSEGAPLEESAIEGAVEQLARRDGLDSARALSPLHCAEDAHVIDTTPLSADEVIDAVLALWNTVELPDAAAAHPQRDHLPQHDHPPQHDNLQDSATGATR